MVISVSDGEDLMNPSIQSILCIILDKPLDLKYLLPEHNSSLKDFPFLFIGNGLKR